MRRFILGLMVLGLLTGEARAQSIEQPAGVTSMNGQTGAVTVTVPDPASSTPVPEVVGGAVGSAVTYMRSDAVIPRISRATTVTTTTGGVFSGTWATALAATPNIVLVPVYTGVGNATCFLTAAPTTTTFAGKCTTDQSALLNLSIVTAGLTIGPIASPTGMSVQVFAIPPTQ